MPANRIPAYGMQVVKYVKYIRTEVNSQIDAYCSVATSMSIYSLPW